MRQETFLSPLVGHGLTSCLPGCHGITLESQVLTIPAAMQTLSTVAYTSTIPHPSTVQLPPGLWEAQDKNP